MEGAGDACASWEVCAAGPHLRGCLEMSGGAPEVFGGAQRHLGLPDCFWGWVLFFSPSGRLFFPLVLVRASQGGGPSRGVPRPGWLLAGGGCCVCKAGAAGMKHVPAGCGTPQPALGVRGTPNPWGDAPVCPTLCRHGTPQPAPAAAKSPRQVQAMGHNGVQTPHAPNCSPQGRGGLILRCPGGFS